MFVLLIVLLLWIPLINMLWQSFFRTLEAPMTLFQWFLTGGTRTTWGYEEPRQGVRSTKVFRDTRSGNLNQILLNIHRDSL